MPSFALECGARTTSRGLPLVEETRIMGNGNGCTQKLMYWELQGQKPKTTTRWTGIFQYQKSGFSHRSEVPGAAPVARAPISIGPIRNGKNGGSTKDLQPGKVNVVAESLSRKEQRTTERVRALVMTLELGSFLSNLEMHRAEARKSETSRKKRCWREFGYHRIVMMIADCIMPCVPQIEDILSHPVPRKCIEVKADHAETIVSWRSSPHTPRPDIIPETTEKNIASVQLKRSVMPDEPLSPIRLDDFFFDDKASVYAKNLLRSQIREVKRLNGEFRYPRLVQGLM
ncbi:hypothetical protein Tco_1404571 [Tanacetum coccineum]